MSHRRGASSPITSLGAYLSSPKTVPIAAGLPHETVPRNNGKTIDGMHLGLGFHIIQNMSWVR